MIGWCGTVVNVDGTVAEIVPDPAKMDEIAPKVIEALKTVYDPEIPVNIFEMGLIYDVIVDQAGQVGVKMTLTAQIGRAHV